MELAGQGSAGPTWSGRVESDDRGYVLAVLLMSMAIAAIWMSTALPAWRHQAQRERELEAIFRGEQYGRAIALFYIKNNCTLPQDVDTLVSGHFLRKKWKDPIDNDDFNLIGGSSTSGQPIPAGVGSSFQQPAPQQGQSQQVGVSGVSPKSTATSIVVYNNQQQYSLWMFTYASALQKMGQNCQRGGPNGGRNGPPGQGGQQPRGPGGTTPPGGGPTPPGGRSPGGGGPGLTPRPGAGEQAPIPPGPVRQGPVGGGSGS